MENSGRHVKFVRWPAEASIRNHLRKEGIPCLLVVEGGAQPPICTDVSEDWIRAPISHQDVQARVRALQQRTYGRKVPVLDSTGVLYFRNKTVTVSNAQVELMEKFIEHYEEVVYRAELEQQLAKRVPAPTRNSLDLHIMRLRRRISMVNLSIRTVWGRGYMLEPQFSEKATL
ncbi:winged helix-turn-helix domain-containing protein [Streptomyces sp. NPDC059340]|uniref:winged helix-turn-helix domain-containing protein n=1 Tax=Streptomyces TaxID=1883 RepID=UPI0006CCF433|nr:transcriptional regulator, winged helix family [Actinobacteria bacterium OK006]